MSIRLNQVKSDERALGICTPQAELAQEGTEKIKTDCKDFGIISAR